MSEWTKEGRAEYWLEGATSSGRVMYRGRWYWEVCAEQWINPWTSGWADSKEEAMAKVETKVVGKTAAFDAKPHGTLYPPVFNEKDMRPEVRAALINHIRTILGTVAPNPQDWTRIWLIGSGASYNWSENGDLDVQVWVSPTKAPSIDPRVFLKDVRAALEPHRGETLDDIGLGGAMVLQMYAKLGEGTEQENTDQKPYALYDLDNGKWVVYPEVMSNVWYADRLEKAELDASKVASQAEELLAQIAQSSEALYFWRDVANDDPEYSDRVDEYVKKLSDANEELATLYDSVVRERQKAYTPEGEGINDPRDSVVKVLEMWGVKERMYAAVTAYRATLPPVVAKSWSYEPHEVEDILGGDPTIRGVWQHGKCGRCDGAIHQFRGGPWIHDFPSDHAPEQVSVWAAGEAFQNGALIDVSGYE